MSNGKKIAIIIACVMTGVGILILLAAVIGINFDFTRLNTVKTERVSYTIEEDFDSIEINCADSDVRFVKSTDGKCRVECIQEENIIHTAEVMNGVLTISQGDERNTRDHFIIIFDFAETGVTVYLPEEEYESLYVKTLSGDIAISEGFSFSDAEVSTESGDVMCLAKANGKLTIESKSGDAELMNSSAEEILVKSLSGDVMIYSANADSKLTAEALSGDVEVRDANADNLSASSTSGDIELLRVSAVEFNAVTTSGDIEFSRCDADDIRMKSTSGDITGSLLSEKMFSVHTTSGHVNVPDDGGSGKCEISTTSGNVNMRIDK